MNASDRSQLDQLPAPLKTLALEASTGSLAGIQAFHNHLADNVLTEDEARIVLHVTIVGLATQDLPRSPDESKAQLIQCAALSLSCIAHISHHTTNPAFIRYLSEFIAKQHAIFPWLTSFQHWFCNPTHLPAVGSTPLVSESTMLHILTGIIKPFYVIMEDVDLTGQEYNSIVDPFLELWPMLLDIDWETRPKQPMMTLIESVNSIIFNFLARSFENWSRSIIDKLGGPSSIISICLAFTDRYYIPAAQTKQKDPTFYSFLGRSLIPFFELLLQFIARGFVSDLLSSAVISRITRAVKRLIQDRKKLIAHKGMGSREVSWTDDAVMLYCRLISNCPASGDDVALLESFKLGIVQKLRTHGFSTSSTLEQDKQLGAFIEHITAHSVYPTILQQSLRLITVPIGSRQRNTWENFDMYIRRFYQQAWDKADEMAAIWDVCTTCKRTSEDCERKVCGGCRVFKYCSEACQRSGWKSGHRISCKLLQYSRGDHHLINTDNARGLLYMSLLEDTIRQRDAFVKNVDSLLSLNNPLPPWELPLLHYKLEPLCVKHQIKRFHDYPDIFGSDIWRRTLIPMIKERIAAGKMHKYLVVVSLPLGPKDIHILSPLSTLTAIGILIPPTRG